MNRKELSKDYPRTVVALVTPIKSDAIDDDNLKKLIRFHFAAKTGAVLVCGTTGESATMSHDEHKHVIDVAMEAAGEFRKEYPDAPTKIWAGSGSNSTKEAVDLTKHASNAGVDVLLVITPYYNKPTPAGMLHHFRTIADATDTAIVAYNVPGRTGVNLAEDTVVKLAEIPNIAGVKEASGNVVQIMRIVMNTPDDFLVWSGEDAQNLPILSVGGVGAISVTANIVPWAIERVARSFEEGKTHEALRIHQRIMNLHEAMFFETNPIPVKTSVNLIHEAWSKGTVKGPLEDHAELLSMVPSAGELRPPMVPMNTSNLERLKGVLKEHGLI
jgi:4-hydroxy-tetrahydrodipicolinate synthase